MDISIIISYYNERNILLNTLARLDQVAANLRVDLVENVRVYVVDDASTDDSWDLLSGYLPVNYRLVGFRVGTNIGVTDSFLLALEKAEGDYFVYLDSDLQDPPELIEGLLRHALDNSLDVVHTRRSKRHGESWYKMLITYLGYRFVRLVSNADIPSDCGDFKLFSNVIRERLLSFTERVVYLRHLFYLVGGRQGFLDYERDERADGAQNTKMRLLSSKVLDYWFFRALGSTGANSLKLVVFVGASFLFFTMLASIAVMLMKWSGVLVSGSAGPMLATFLMGSINLFMLGIVGIFVSLNSQESKHRPRYFVDEEFVVDMSNESSDSQ